MGRAGGLAGSGACLRNSKGPWNGLGIEFVDCLSGRKILVIFVIQLYGTDLFTFATTGALGKVNKTGLLQYLSLEMTYFSL